MKNKDNNPIVYVKCSFCGKDLGEEEMMVLEEAEQRASFHATCVKCGNSSIIFISGGQAGIISMGMATDLDKNEVKEKFLSDSISADEIIDIHRRISGHSGNLSGFIANTKD